MAAAPTRAARRLFGTDGVRGVAGEFLTAELALSLARAATARVKPLALRELRPLPGLLEAGLLALDLARVPRQVALALERHP